MEPLPFVPALRGATVRSHPHADTTPHNTVFNQCLSERFMGQIVGHHRINKILKIPPALGKDRFHSH